MYLRTNQGYMPVDAPSVGQVAEEASRYGGPDSKSVVVPVYSTQAVQEEGRLGVVLGRLTIPQSFACPGVHVIRMDAGSMEPIIGKGAYVGLDTEQRLVNMMIGRDLVDYFPKRESRIGEVVFKAEHIKAGSAVKDISFDVREGEVVGLSGLIGSGRTEAIRAMLGIDVLESGKVVLHGREVKIHSAKHANELIPRAPALVRPEQIQRYGLPRSFPPGEAIFSRGCHCISLPQKATRVTRYRKRAQTTCLVPSRQPTDA